MLSTKCLLRGFKPLFHAEPTRAARATAGASKFTIWNLIQQRQNSYIFTYYNILVTGRRKQLYSTVQLAWRAWLTPEPRVAITAWNDRLVVTEILAPICDLSLAFVLRLTDWAGAATKSELPTRRQHCGGSLVLHKIGCRLSTIDVGGWMAQSYLWNPSWIKCLGLKFFFSFTGKFLAETSRKSNKTLLIEV